METARKVDCVLSIMGQLGPVKDGGHCGPRGRTILVLGKGPVKVGAVFFRDPSGGAYKLEFSIGFDGTALPAQITSAAWHLAESQNHVPMFEPGESLLVSTILQERLAARPQPEVG